MKIVFLREYPFELQGIAKKTAKWLVQNSLLGKTGLVQIP
jgi:hypothetical protein